MGICESKLSLCSDESLENEWKHKLRRSYPRHWKEVIVKLTLRLFYRPRNDTYTHSIGGPIDSRTGLDILEKVKIP